MYIVMNRTWKESTPRPGQNGRHFAEGIFRYIFVTEIFSILVIISLKNVPMALIENKLVLV